MDQGLGASLQSTHGPVNTFFNHLRHTQQIFHRYMRGEDNSLDPLIKDFIIVEAEQQKVANPSGDFKSGEGLGEPKFHINLTAYEDVWSRPQRGTRAERLPCRDPLFSNGI